MNTFMNDLYDIISEYQYTLNKSRVTEEFHKILDSIAPNSITDWLLLQDVEHKMNYLGYDVFENKELRTVIIVDEVRNLVYFFDEALRHTGTYLYKEKDLKEIDYNFYMYEIEKVLHEYVIYFVEVDWYDKGNNVKLTSKAIRYFR